MRRRDFFTILCGAAAAWPLTARAQQPATMRIGVVMGLKESDPTAQSLVAAFRQELRQLGWTERNLAIDVRYPGDDRVQILADIAELMSKKPDLMVANSNLVTEMLQKEVRTLPLLFIGAANPIESGIVTNFARPTGNVTGFSSFEVPMAGKWLEVLKEIAPHVDHFGFMLQPETPANVRFLKATEAAVVSIKGQVTALGVHNADEIARSLGAFAVGSNRGLIIAPHAVTRVNTKLIIELADRYRLPAIYASAVQTRAGGLISYGIDTVSQFRQGAAYADRLLKGAKPADLPVQTPTKLELVVNLKTAKTLGLTVPPALLTRADEVIE